MKDFRIKEVREEIRKKYRFEIPISIFLVTYNRLFYLQKCVWSIIASTSIPYNIYVIDDCSNDGVTQSWLLMMKQRGLIKDVIINRIGIGTANCFNTIIKDKNSDKFFVMGNDDIWYHKYWDYACMDIINEYSDCGIVSFYDYTRLRIDEGNEVLNDSVMRVGRTGLCSIFLNRELFEKAGMFKLPDGKRMGFFATPFCFNVMKTNIERNKIYSTIPNYSNDMDLKFCKLNEQNEMALNGYTEMRRMYKRGLNQKDNQ